MAGKIIQVIPDIRTLVMRAVADLGSDLQGMSVIDLVMDNTDLSVADAKTALVMAGVDDKLSAAQIMRYSR